MQLEMPTLVVSVLSNVILLCLDECVFTTVLHELLLGLSDALSLILLALGRFLRQVCRNILLQRDLLRDYSFMGYLVTRHLR